MIEIHKWATSSPDQMEMIIEGMRNPLNSWGRIDSYASVMDFHLGDADYDLMSRLADGGPVHAKYRRMMDVIVHITAPLYWWKEFDTYKVGTVSNSCSTMHKIHAKEFTIDDVSCEELTNGIAVIDEENTFANPLHIMEGLVRTLNVCRSKYLQLVKEKKKGEAKDIWRQMIQLLPSSYNQRRTIKLNYEVLANIYHSRRTHKLTEWHTFCEWIEKLPYSDLITRNKVEEE